MRSFALLTLLALAACDPTADDTNTAPGTDTNSDMSSDTGSGIPSWSNDVRPALVDFCSSCHGAGECSSNVCWLDDPTFLSMIASASVCNGSTVAECIPTRILDGSMPRQGSCLPGHPGCMTQDEFDTLQAWVDAGTPDN